MSANSLRNSPQVWKLLNMECRSRRHRYAGGGGGGVTARRNIASVLLILVMQPELSIGGGGCGYGLWNFKLNALRPLT